MYRLLFKKKLTYIIHRSELFFKESFDKLSRYFKQQDTDDKNNQDEYDYHLTPWRES